MESFVGKIRYDRGLSEKEAQSRLNKYGPNTILEKKKVSAFKILLEQFTDFMVLILLAATAISAFMGEMMEAVTIVAIVIVNALLGFIQEYRTERTLEALKNLAAPSARVIRDGKVSVIPAAQVVPPDVIIIETGDRVPADAILIESSNLAADESLLTGESIPVEKHALKKLNLKAGIRNNAGFENDLNIKDKENLIYMGTIITSGRGKAVVYATGMKTEMGKIADMIQNIEDEQTPLQRKLEHLGKFIVYACMLICAVVSVTGILRGEDLFTMLLAGISLAVAAVPEGLPAIVTVSLALGVQRMLKRNALIRKLPAVETLGCADIICSDKTGTLTENKMTVRKIYAGENIYEVRGSGYDTKGDFLIKGKKIDPMQYPILKLTLEIGALCNNAQLVRVVGNKQTPPGEIKSKISKIKFRKTGWLDSTGDPTEVALLVVAAKGGLTREMLDEIYIRQDEIPFDSERKCMSVICRNHKNESFIFTKGAPDIIIQKCSKILTTRGIVSLTPDIVANILKINDSMAGEALRVLGVAYRQSNRQPTLKDNVEEELVFVGLLGMIDPPREEAAEAVQKCKLAGIKPVMITGDHKITACAVAGELNIYADGDIVLTGADLDGMSEDKLAKVIDKVSVFARVSPKHKLSIVKAFKKLGHIVAMTGDGVNDAPAVKEADIGVSMGIMGTDVTKEVSSMVLMDDNFATIVAAVEEGRVIYSNIRKFIRYLLSCNIGEVLTMFLGMLAGLPVPLLPIQILWVNLVTDGLPAIALGLEPPEKDVMMRPPRETGDNIFSDGLLSLITIRGLLLGISTLAVFASMLYFTYNVALARTGAFVTLVITQLIHVFECKSERKNIFEIPIFNNIYLVLAVLCSFIMILSVVYIPFLKGAFRTVSLNLDDWLLIIGFSFIGPVGSSLFTRKRR
ncbi:MAG: cation-translocating P-type ATPase [Firmicutes bacterium]|nr:cation-translocating P-type ATPase [Bacillota bacterium]